MILPPSFGPGRDGNGCPSSCLPDKHKLKTNEDDEKTVCSVLLHLVARPAASSSGSDMGNDFSWVSLCFIVAKKRVSWLLFSLHWNSDSSMEWSAGGSKEAVSGQDQIETTTRRGQKQTRQVRIV